jgi:L-cystine uptake protein TcyP (sodium:dicarboxylate symporter family)
MSKVLSIFQQTTKFFLIITLVFFYLISYIVIVIPIKFFSVLDSTQTFGDRTKYFFGFNTRKRKKEKEEEKNNIKQSINPLNKIFLLLLNLIKK